MMTRFYRNLWGADPDHDNREMSRLDALREAQLYLLNHSALQTRIFLAV